MLLNINISLPDTDDTPSSDTAEHEICVSEDLTSVSKSQIEIIIKKMEKVLESQGILCFHCPKSRYKLYPLSNDCKGMYITSAKIPEQISMGLSILCRDTHVYGFELTLTPIDLSIGGYDYEQKDKY